MATAVWSEDLQRWLSHTMLAFFIGWLKSWNVEERTVLFHSIIQAIRLVHFDLNHEINSLLRRSHCQMALILG